MGYILGLNWKWHDASAALIDESGHLQYFCEEERLNRIRHSWLELPRRAATWCLESAGIEATDLDAIAIGWDLEAKQAWLSSDRSEFYEAFLPHVRHGSRVPELVFVRHHLAHAASTFYSSGFSKAAILVVDGSGEEHSISIYSGSSDGIKPLRSWHRGYSLGVMYDAATTLLGLGDLAEGKTMGLASYGRALGAPYLVEHSLSEDGPGLISGSPSGDADYAEHKGYWCQRLTERFGEVATGADLLDRDVVAVRIAASVQRTVEEVMRELHAEATCLSGTNQVCLAGGVALNSVANGRLPEPLFVPPFAHDAGVALGAAWILRPPSEQRRLMSPYLGSELDSGYADLARDYGHRVKEFDPSRVAHLLASGLIGAVVEGRAEIGPRALGHRSIIARPHPSGMRDKVNLRKGRELWRPVAPVTTDKYADRLWPRNGARDLYMTGNTFVSELARAQMPAAIHVDGTTRPQRLPSSHASVVSDILRAVEAGGDAPILINTSFNGPGEPIVDTAAHAISAYDRLGLDFLILGDSLLERPRPMRPD